jgi:hypothetical protein
VTEETTNASPGPIKPEPTEREKLQIDLAWKWFLFHADQRTKMFNFMLVVLGIFATGVVSAIDKGMALTAIELCVAAVILAIGFAQLDRRNRDLVWMGEEVLTYLESTVIFDRDKITPRSGKETIDYGLLHRQHRESIRDKIAEAPWYKQQCIYAKRGMHRFWLPCIAYLIALLFVLLGIYTALHGSSSAASGQPPPKDVERQHATVQSGIFISAPVFNR